LPALTYQFSISFKLGPDADHLDHKLVSNWLRTEHMTGSLAGIGSRLDGPLDCSFRICLQNQTPQAYLEQWADDLVEYAKQPVQLEASYFCYEEIPRQSLKIQRDPA
jgi:hypothetical protein